MSDKGILTPFFSITLRISRTPRSDLQILAQDGQGSTKSESVRFTCVRKSIHDENGRALSRRLGASFELLGKAGLAARSAIWRSKESLTKGPREGGWTSPRIGQASERPDRAAGKEGRDTKRVSRYGSRSRRGPTKLSLPRL